MKPSASHEVTAARRAAVRQDTRQGQILDKF